MSSANHLVSIHPYFKPHAGKVEAFRALLPRFVSATTPESDNHYYEFSFNGTEFFCREGYTNAAAVLVHLGNVGPVLEEALKISDLVRLELHGPAAELDQLRGPLAQLNIQWFALEIGVIH